MLAYILALAVGLGSIAIYLTAFFFPEIHRKNDFIWSGVGLFYALVLWVFAQRITGGLLLGHVASVALLYWFGWQTLSLRRQLIPTGQQTQIPSADSVKTTIQAQVNKLSLPEKLGQLQRSVGNTFGGVKDKVQQTASKKTPSPTPTPETPVATIKPPVDTTVPEAIPPNPPSPELVEAAQADAEVIEVKEITPNTEVSPPTEVQADQTPPNPS
ncbi:Ycf66 family protein [Aetokthonos hydrillicola Thurmond2011]|jgi:hypothetical protein|uniref:Ycf66 family protein n=1 Tax=Aetokthonos hydrillicola Thurmond2011 TaxID=2712845 RepID=A0AAP5IAR8_9CYAN|nr:Ycf66 family protein [Aetokthonos hydrillicola]MBO3460328.1 hypothetical protein [Aetokthonos hydrillicola CCALA 1050]MBW4590782.1 Ycf66 family protein [Aetokthonos hydrillicola CCALA 1050]MDR9898043.1 Ycf66 family protein [Aetokthonos hydrillicola Thurmond2011]